MDRAATEKAFQGWWFHTRNLAVMHPDGYMAARGRAKDIVITGGRININLPKGAEMGTMHGLRT